MKVRIVTTAAELNDAFTVRKIVFVDEQHVPEEEEIDQFEDDATHIVLYDGEQPVGAGRFRVIDGLGKVERICVMASFLMQGAGKLIMIKIEDIAREAHVPKLKLNAQTQAEAFYTSLGYQTVSPEVFMDAGIPHVTMIKELS